MELQKNNEKTSPTYGIFANQLFQRIQIRMKVHKVVMHWKKLTKRSQNRHKRIQQWVKTQKSYIQDLNIIVDQIQKPLRQKNIITQEEQRIIFPNMKGLILLSQQMHDTMQIFLVKWNPLKTVIAPAVIKLSNFFKIYIQYFNNYLKGKQILDKIRQRPEVIAIQKKLKMDFDSYLSKPTQRPVKYKLLLTDYHKKLRSDHPDFNSLSQAIKIYHNVVQKTNMALQAQKKMKRMIQIQSKYKNIIQSSRQWKNQYQANILHENCKIFVFTDLILITVRKGYFARDQLMAKIYLNGSSFCEATPDGLYYQNKLLVCGVNGVANFIFNYKQDRDKAFQQIYQVINDLFNNQDKRRQAISRFSSGKFQSQRLSKPYFNQIDFVQYHKSTILYKSLKISVQSVQKRYVQKYQKLYFVLKLQLSFPEVINHKSVVSYQRLIQLETMIRKLYPNLIIQSISQLPKQIPNQSTFSFQSRTIQYRSILIQIFLNTLLRRQQSARSLNIICNRINLMQCFFQYLTFEFYQCICDICQNGNIINSIKTYQEQKQNRKIKKQQNGQQNLCIFRSFHTQNKVASIKIKQSRYCLANILLYLNCKLGNINHELTNRIIQSKAYKVKIHFLSLNSAVIQKDNSQFIQVTFYRNDRVADIMQILKLKLKIDHLRDFKLILVNNQNSFLLSEGELMLDLINEAGVIDQLSINKQEKQSYGFFSKIKDAISDKVKQWKKTTCKIFIKKVIILQKQVQIEALLGSKARANLIINQIFYRFKNQQLLLPVKSLYIFSALYVCLQKNQILQALRKENIKKQLFEQLFPKNKIKKLNDQFLTQIYKIVKLYQEKKLTTIQIFQKMMLEIVSQTQGWKNYYFNVQNVNPKSLPGGEKNLKLGISFQQLTIVRLNNLNKQLKIDFQGLNIVIGGCYLLIKSTKDYIFLCKNSYGFKSLIQIYEAYNFYFLGKVKNLKICLMQETF